MGYPAIPYGVVTLGMLPRWRRGMPFPITLPDYAARFEDSEGNWAVPVTIAN